MFFHDRVDPRKFSVIKYLTTPKTLTDVRNFFGLIDWFIRFIENCSGVAAPHTTLTKKDQGMQKWDSILDNSFELLKEWISTFTILIYPNRRRKVRTIVDASLFPLGGNLTPLDESSHDRMIAFFSKNFLSAENDYTTNDRELMGLIIFLETFLC